ncbi:hypothetical protein BK138_29395 [Paenibacillus rhizosphaerae]|uniref:YqzN/YkzM domain-containing protein n=1 Tax=Paenibacillus rhizosphaerae TaxID=297318 RepID=A0A1R1ECU5_9BACL|nr:hypothetical protein [Paenibacillus rhizosphaerae]OMF49599.1 hypothetical protein BK138_29395 [Paenibacillus rhizosphaerae]
MGVKKISKTPDAGGGMPRYELKELKAQAKELFGVRAEVVAGAMHDMDGQHFSIAEVQGKIQQFMKAKVV